MAEQIVISIVMPCYNSELFVKKTINSIINQSYINWELIIVNDGSTDNTAEILNSIMKQDKRIKVFKKSNGGYVSARLFGLKLININSSYIHFMDSDDILDSKYYKDLINILQNDQTIGAIYSDHILIDEYDSFLAHPNYGQRYYPTRFWLKKILETNPNMPFCSIFSWSKMIEPMVLIRKSIYNNTSGWDDRFGLGKGNIGEGVLLFCEISLISKIYFHNKQLYFYRKHGKQATSNEVLNKKAVEKVIGIWKEKVEIGIITANEYEFMLMFLKRLEILQILGSFKHYLKTNPISAIKSIKNLVIFYFKTYKLVLFGTKHIKRLLPLYFT